MDDLKELLDISTLNETEILDRFKKIAEDLMCNYIIKKGEKEYAIIEIEFYLYTPKHQDFITYPRKMDAGRWFFHPSGVDLTFKTDGKTQEGEDDKRKKYIVYKDCSFGGILIRGLFRFPYSDDENKRHEAHYIFGPQKCVNELWDDFNAFEVISEEYPKIIIASEEEKVALNSQPINCYRHIKVAKSKWINKITQEWIKHLNLIRKENEIKSLKDNIQSYSIKLLDNKEFPYRFFNIIDGENTWKEIKHLTNTEKKDLKKLIQG